MILRVYNNRLSALNIGRLATLAGCCISHYKEAHVAPLVHIRRFVSTTVGLTMGVLLAIHVNVHLCAALLADMTPRSITIHFNMRTVDVVLCLFHFLVYALPARALSCYFKRILLL